MSQSALTPQVPAAPAPPTTPASFAPTGSPPPGGPPINPFRSGGLTPTPPPAPGVSATPATAFTPQPARPPAPAAPPAPTQPLGPGPAPPAPAGGSQPSMDAIRRAVPGIDQLSGLYDRARTAVEGAVGRNMFSDRTTPPLIRAGATEALPEGIRGPAEGVLRFAQRNLQDNPGMFAQVVGGLGKPIVEPLLGTAAGLPLMAGLYGTLTGGESGEAAYNFFRPVIDKVRGQ